MAENLLALLKRSIIDVERDWGAVAVAVVMDASGESRKACRLLGKKYTHIVVLDCYAHQVRPCNFETEHLLIIN